MFARRDPKGIRARVADAVAPRKGWRRGFAYLGHRMRRLPDSPHRVALGVAAGVFVSFSPFFGFHLLYAAGVAWLLRGNILAALIGTAVSNPLTFPAIALSSLGLGRWMTGATGAALDFMEISRAFGAAFSALWQEVRAAFGFGGPPAADLGPFWAELFLPYLAGGTVAGALAGLAAYLVSRPVVAAFQSRRRTRRMAAAREKVDFPSPGTRDG